MNEIPFSLYLQKFSFKKESCYLNAFNLNCNDWQDLNRDAIELIEAAPSSSLSKTLKKKL